MHRLLFLGLLLRLLTCDIVGLDATPAPIPRQLSIDELSEGELKLIRGVGPVLAAKIKAEGHFRSRDIRGIGPRMEEKLKKYLRD